MIKLLHTTHHFSLSSQVDEQYQATCSAQTPIPATGTREGEALFNMELLANWLTRRHPHDVRAWLESHLVELCCPYIIALLTAMLHETPSYALAQELRWRRDILLWTQRFNLDVAWHMVTVPARELLRGPLEKLHSL